MKIWLTKLRISNTLDGDKPLPPSIQRALATSPELRHFAENVASLDKALKNTRPAPAAPAGLHAAILRAVCSAETTGVAETSGWEKFWQRLVPVSALGLLILLGVLGVGRFFRTPPVVPSSASSPSLALAGSTLETGDELVRTAPSAAFSPLSDEMRRLNRDLTSAQNYLLASLP